jgi:hypothetical protein
MPVECIVPVGIQPLRRPGIRCYTSDLLYDIDDFAGLPVTSPTRTAVDLMRWLPPFLALGVGDAMTRAGLVSVEGLRAGVEYWPGRRGTARARRLATLVEPLAESFPESWLRLRLIDAGFPRPEVQIRVEDATGALIYRLDMGWRARRVAIEYDGEEVHDGPSARQRDDARRTRLEKQLGWRAVIGVGRGEVLGRSMALEWAVGDLLGLEPTIRRRRW